MAVDLAVLTGGYTIISAFTGAIHPILTPEANRHLAKTVFKSDLPNRVMKLPSVFVLIFDDLFQFRHDTPAFLQSIRFPSFWRCYLAATISALGVVLFAVLFLSPTYHVPDVRVSLHYDVDLDANQETRELRVRIRTGDWCETDTVGACSWGRVYYIGSRIALILTAIFALTAIPTYLSIIKSRMLIGMASLSKRRGIVYIVADALISLGILCLYLLFFICLALIVKFLYDSWAQLTSLGKWWFVIADGVKYGHDLFWQLIHFAVWGLLEGPADWWAATLAPVLGGIFSEPAQFDSETWAPSVVGVLAPLIAGIVGGVFGAFVMWLSLPIWVVASSLITVVWMVIYAALLLMARLGTYCRALNEWILKITKAEAQPMLTLNVVGVVMFTAIYLVVVAGGYLAEQIWYWES